MSRMYDHLTDSGKDMWSNLFLLVDTAVVVQEHEDDRKKSFFYLFPRKKRSSLVKRRYTQQNPNGTCMLYSSSLDDYMKKKPQNPSFFDVPVVYDAELLRAKKGKSKIVCEDYEFRGEKRLFEKKVTRLVKNLRGNFDGSSTSSSTFLNIGCYKPSLLLGYNTAKSEKTEMKDPNYQPSSPSSYQTENTTRGKRCALQERKNGKFKKAKLDSFTRRTNPETPEWIFQTILT